MSQLKNLVESLMVAAETICASLLGIESFPFRRYRPVPIPIRARSRRS